MGTEEDQAEEQAEQRLLRLRGPGLADLAAPALEAKLSSVLNVPEDRVSVMEALTPMGIVHALLLT